MGMVGDALAWVAWGDVLKWLVLMTLEEMPGGVLDNIVGGAIFLKFLPKTRRE